MELIFRTLRPADSDANDTDVLQGYAQAVNRGFHLDRLDVDQAARSVEHAAADDAVLRGAWLPEGTFGAGPVPVATLTSWDGELNTGSGLVGLRMISDVTVAAAHRRRGVARRLITDDLDDAARAGLPVAGLTVSEGTIYRRFGFGPATFRARLEVDVTSRFAMEHPHDVAQQGRVGRCVEMEPAEMWPTVQHVFGRWHAGSRGSVSRHAFYHGLSTGQFDWESQEPVLGLRGAVHLDEHDRPDGFVLHTHTGWDVDDGVLTVQDFVALGPGAHLGLWGYLAGVDLTGKVRTTSHVDDPLRWALTDPRCVKQTSVEDGLWLRVLDVPAALAARPWYGDGAVDVAVTDSLGHAAGTWRVLVRDGDVEVTASDATPQVRLDVSTLSSLYLGGVHVETLALTGRVTGERIALRTLGAMADGGDVPFCRTLF